MINPTERDNGDKLWDEDPWTHRTPARPWMTELARPGQEVAFFSIDHKKITEWQPTRRSFTIHAAFGTAYHLGIRRAEQVKYVELDSPLTFTGDWQSYWSSPEPPR